MPYTPPASEKLYKTIDELLTNYSGTNEEHKALIKFAQAIHQSKTATDEARRGAMYIALLALSSSNFISSSKKKTLFGQKLCGSELDDLLRTGLKMGSGNKMEDQDYILILSELFGELERHPGEYAGLIKNLQPKRKNWIYKQVIWEDFASLKEHVLKTVKPYLRKNSNTIGNELNRVMTSQQWKIEIDNVIHEYKALAKKNASRNPQMDFMQFINEMCEVYEEPNNAKMGLNQETAKLFSKPLQLRLAVYSVVMDEVENERVLYRWGITKPEGSWLNNGSDFYKKMRRIYNLTHISNMNLDDRETCLKDILGFLDKQRFAVLEELAKGRVDQNIIESVKNNLSKISQKIMEDLKKVADTPRQPPKTVHGKAANYTSNLTAHALNTGLTKGATWLVPDVGRQAARGVGGTIGYLVFGPWGSFLGAFAADHLVGILAPQAMAGGVLSETKQATEKVGKIAGGMVSIAIYPFEAGIRYALSEDPEVRAAQEKCIAENEKLLKGLQYLPPNAFPSYMSLARDRKEISVIDEHDDLEMGNGDVSIPDNSLTHESSAQLERRGPSQ